MTPAFRYACTLVRVIDGDTYVLDVDLGFRVHTHITVRLRGVDCPEMNTPAGKAAAKAVAGYFTTGRVTLESYKDVQSFARWVADVWVGGIPLADLLRADGHLLIA